MTRGSKANPYISVDEYAELHATTRANIIRYIYEGRLPFTSIHGHFKVRRNEPYPVLFTGREKEKGP